MQTFRKKPVEIQAMRWDGTAVGATPIIDWILATGASATYRCADHERCSQHDGDSPHTIAISTLEGTMAASIGDWIVRGVKGEFYPCKPDIFAATHEPTERPESERKPTCQYCLADPRYTPPASSEAVAGRCPVCGARYSGPRRDAEYAVLVAAGLVVRGD